MGEEERLSAIIGIRVTPRAKKLFQEIADQGGETLSHLVWELIVAGLDVKQEELDEPDESHVEQKG